MQDGNSGDCPSRADNNTMYAERLPVMVDRALAEAGVTKEVRAKVQASLGELKYGGGQVTAAWTTQSARTFFVKDARSGASANFAFPPNKDVFQSELIRAQDTGRIVSVSYREDASGHGVLEDIWIYAGVAAGGNPRY